MTEPKPITLDEHAPITEAIGIPASCSLIIPMICASVKRLFLMSSAPSEWADPTSRRGNSRGQVMFDRGERVASIFIVNTLEDLTSEGAGIIWTDFCFRGTTDTDGNLVNLSWHVFGESIGQGNHKTFSINQFDPDFIPIFSLRAVAGPMSAPTQFLCQCHCRQAYC